MQVLVLGAGPSGSAAALLLARAGHEVALVDRDPGPHAGPSGAEWDRVGVMQFHLPQTLRAPGRLVLESRLPDVHQALVDAGGVLDEAAPGAPAFTANLHIRRSVMERAVWDCVDAEPGIARRTGHVERLLVDGRTVSGAVVDGQPHRADLVVDATGKAGRLGGELRGEERVDCGFAYVARAYALHPGAAHGPVNGGPGWAVEHDGFMELVFRQDAGTFQTLVVRLADDEALAELRHEATHDRAVRELKGLSQWCDPSRSTPIGPVRAGGGLVNRYRPQPRAVEGLLSVGDAACTTNPIAARGISLGLQAAVALADVVASRDRAHWAEELESWCLANLRPWFEDHVALDVTMRARWRHEELDPEGPIGWDVVGLAAREHPEWTSTLGPFFGMFAMPASLDGLREETRVMLRDGWRPSPHSGLTRDELVTALAAELVAAG